MGACGSSTSCCSPTPPRCRSVLARSRCFEEPAVGRQSCPVSDSRRRWAGQRPDDRDPAVLGRHRVARFDLRLQEGAAEKRRASAHGSAAAGTLRAARDHGAIREHSRHAASRDRDRAATAGPRWVAVVGPHRRSLQPVNGGLHLGQRFAIDFAARLDAEDRSHTGAPTRTRATSTTASRCWPSARAGWSRSSIATPIRFRTTRSRSSWRRRTAIT